MDWVDYRHEFITRDGVIHIRINEVISDDWLKIFNFLQQTDVCIKFFIDDVESALPPQIEPIFQDVKHHYLLSLDFENVILNCFFDSRNEIIFRIDPRLITTESKATLLFRVMSTFGRRIKKVVLLTKEGNVTQPIFRYQPGQGLTYLKLDKKLAPYD